MLTLAIAEKFQLLQYAIILLIPLVIICFVLIRQQKFIQYDDSAFSDINFDIPISSCSLLKIYGILLLAVITWVMLTGSRGWVFLILIFLMYSVTILQIFAKKIIHTKTVLLELILTTTILVLTKIFSYPYYYGGTDVIAHSQIISSLISTSGSIPTELSSGYTNYLLYHIYVACTSLVSGLDIHTSVYIACAFPIILGIIFVYYLALYFSGSKRVSTIAALFYALTPIFLSYATGSMPRTMGTLAFVMVLYLLYHKTSLSLLSTSILTIIIVIYMTMVHHAQIPLFLLVVTLLCFIQILYRHQFTSAQKISILSIYSIPLLYYAYTYISNIIPIIKSNFFGTIESVEISETVEIVSEGFNSVVLITSVTSVIFLLLILFGLYYIISPVQNAKNTIILWPVILVLFLLYVPGIAESSALISSMEQIGRFRIVLAPLFAIVMGIGCVVLYNTSIHVSHSKKTATVLIVILCMALVITSPIIENSKDSDVFSDSIFGLEMNYFDTTDIQMLNMVQTNVRSGSNIYSDFISGRYLPSSTSYSYTNQSFYSYSKYGMNDLFHLQGHLIPEDVYIMFRSDRFQSEVGILIATSRGAYSTKTERITANDIDLVSTYNSNTYRTDMLYNNGASIICYSG